MVRQLIEAGKLDHYKVEITRILGIPFLNAGVDSAIERLRRGHLMVVPAAPAMIHLPFDAAYARALVNADFAIADSMYMVLLWLLIKGERIHRVSGLTFLRTFLDLKDLREEGSLFLVNPSCEEDERNRDWLACLGIHAPIDLSYTAPMYDREVVDEHLLEILRAKRPRYILINIGGGVQEKLGYYLRRNLDYRPGIICSGAAIAFLTGHQARIPSIVDKIGLGWLVRCIVKPKQFIPRYWQALKLAELMICYQECPVHTDTQY